MSQVQLFLMTKRVTSACNTIQLKCNRSKQFIHMSKKRKISLSFRRRVKSMPNDWNPKIDSELLQTSKTSYLLIHRSNKHQQQPFFRQKWTWNSSGSILVKYLGTKKKRRILRWMKGSNHCPIKCRLWRDLFRSSTSEMPVWMKKCLEIKTKEARLKIRKFRHKRNHFPHSDWLLGSGILKIPPNTKSRS